MAHRHNGRRPEELRQAIFQYFLEHGLADASLRPLAKAIGSSPRVLLYYFGSKEQMLADIVAQIRKSQHSRFARIQAASFGEECRLIWKRMSQPETERHFRLYFEAYGIALREPQRYKKFLQATVDDWLGFIADPLVKQGLARRKARVFATVVLAGFRGFMLDYCNTHDRQRIGRAVEIWTRSLDATLPAFKKEAK